MFIVQLEIFQLLKHISFSYLYNTIDSSLSFSLQILNAAISCSTVEHWVCIHVNISMFSIWNHVSATKFFIFQMALSLSGKMMHGVNAACAKGLHLW